MSDILVIDDSGAIRKAIRRILEPMGFAVREAADGQQALDACTTARPRAILCDIDMPVMDGLTFVRELRKLPALSDVPVIMCTTHNTFEKIQEAMMLGASEYIMKPFDAEIIGGKLASCGVAA
jgi:two-component system chemotaxis response regulator CheY